MSLVVRTGSLEEVVVVINEIDEFGQKESIESLAKRLGSKPQLVLVAEEGDQLLGFKMGYEWDEMTFYSWFGGVSPRARGKGVAQALLEYQESWARSQGYTYITVKSRNQFPSMLRLLIRNNYMIDGFEEKHPVIESRIYFRKWL